MSTIDFNRDWEFIKSSALWPDDFREEENSMEPVILPHTWNEDDMKKDSTDSYVGGGSGTVRALFSPSGGRGKGCSSNLKG